MFDRVLNTALSTEQVILDRLPEVKGLLKENLIDCKNDISTSTVHLDDGNTTLIINLLRKLNIKSKHL